MKVDELRIKIGFSDFLVIGIIFYVFDYLFDNGILKGNIVVNFGLVDFNEFMEMFDIELMVKVMVVEEEFLEVVFVLECMIIDVNVNVDCVKYINMVLKDVKGYLVVD